MDIKSILAKVTAGETLTDEEKTALKEYDPDKTANSAAAAARKKAEADLKAAKDRVAELEGQLDEAGSAGKSELEKAQKAIEKLTKTLADKDAAIAKADAERKKNVRDGHISKMLQGIKLMDGVDPELARIAIDRAMAEIADDDLVKEEATRPILDAFMTRNKALIVGDQGGGTGTPPKAGAGGQSGSSDPSKMTAEQRAADLKKRGII
jgi:esterase/lipase